VAFRLSYRHPVAEEKAVPVRAYTRSLRAQAALLAAIAALNLLELAIRIGLDLFAPGATQRAPFPLVVRRLFFLSALPWLLYLITRAFAAGSVQPRDSNIVVRARWGTVDVPRDAIAGIRAWHVPLPEPGVDVVLRSGVVGLSWEAGAVLGGPPFADARARRRLRTLHPPWLKLGVVPAVLTFILFRLHQRIAFGDLFGEAHLFGWRRWTRTLLGVALSTFCTLVIAAVALRMAVELIALASSRLPAPWAERARVVLEVAAAVLYYGGIAAVLVLRLAL
jgi:hypothetical protein